MTVSTSQTAAEAGLNGSFTNSKLYATLAYFNKYEQNRLRKYVQSPYFNADETLVLLFDQVADHLNQKEEERPPLEKEAIWSVMNPNKPYDDVRFRKYCSDLLKLVEGYLIQENLERNPIQQATLLMQAVGQKKLEKLYSSAIRSANRLADSQPYFSANNYFYRYQIERYLYDLTSQEFKRTEKSNLEEIINNLDYFYLSEKLRFFGLAKSRQDLLRHDYQLLLIDEILSSVPKYKLDQVPLISLYYHAIQLYSADASEHYLLLKKQLSIQKEIINPEDANELYTYALNYCYRLVNMGNPKAFQEIFELSNELLQSGLIFQFGELSPWKFRNMVITGLRLQKYDWVEKFINDYQQYLPDSYRENAVSFNLANLYLYKKDFNKLLEHLRNVEYDDLTYNLNSKLMLLMTYYELDEVDLLLNHLETFKTYLTRHKDIKGRNHYLNLIKFTKRLTKIIPGEINKILKLKEEISIEASKTVNTSWLLEKLAELE